MAMQKQLWSINGLATELGLDRRTLCRRLEGLRPAKIEGKVKLYRLQDALSCLDLGSSKNTKGDEVEERTRQFLKEFTVDLFDSLCGPLSLQMRQDIGLPADKTWRIMELLFFWMIFYLGEGLEEKDVQVRLPEVIRDLQDPKKRAELVLRLDSKKDLE